tara:strand:+ start:4216 stop:5001 length:786 start_codon:yes stop_codon:yes gene_type:complete
MITYEEITGWFSFGKFYDWSIENYFKEGMHVVEIGAFQGKSTCYLAQGIKKKFGPNIKLDVVDTWYGSKEPHMRKYNDNWLYDTFNKNMMDAGVSDIVNPVRGDSHQVHNQYEDNSLDWIFLDAGHTFEDVYFDLMGWWPKLKVGGVIAGDDYIGKEGWNLRFSCVEAEGWGEMSSKFPFLKHMVKHAVDLFVLKNLGDGKYNDSDTGTVLELSYSMHNNFRNNWLAHNKLKKFKRSSIDGGNRTWIIKKTEDLWKGWEEK